MPTPVGGAVSSSGDFFDLVIQGVKRYEVNLQPGAIVYINSFDID
ncbi:MAG: hypothetical protein ACPGRE_00820 [Flavobacteriaceae bacterium]